MRVFIKITLLLILVWPKIFFGQTYFNMLYPPEPGTWGGGTSAIIPIDSGFYVNRLAVDSSTGNYTQNFTFIEKNGFNFQIKTILNFPDKSLSSNGLLQIEDKSMVVSITIESYNPLRYQYSIAKYDSLGQIIFHNIDTNLYSFIFIPDIIEINQGNFISVGTLRPVLGSPLHERYALMIKSDNLGNEVWRKTYNIGNYIEQAECVSLCTDGGFIIGGAELIINGPDRFYSPIVIKTDSNGNVQWKKKYGSTEFSNWPAYGITQTQDGGYAFCGGVGVNDTSNIDKQLPWIVKLDSLGNMLWADTNSGENLGGSYVNNNFKDLLELIDGSLVAVGQQKVWYENKPPPAKFRSRGVIKKLSASGAPIWTRYYFHPEIVDNSGAVHFLYDIDPTPDGGFVAAGWASYTADGTQSTWVIKVDSFGCLVQGCEVNSVPKIEPLIAALKVYPNPTNGVLNINITPRLLSEAEVNQNEFTFELYDMLGKRVFSKTLFPFQNQIDISNLANGVYTYKIGETWGKIIKQ